MRAVAKQLGVSPMTAYRYFSDNEALISELRASCFARLADDLDACVKGLRPNTKITHQSYGSLGRPEKKRSALAGLLVTMLTGLSGCRFGWEPEHDEVQAPEEWRSVDIANPQDGLTFGLGAHLAVPRMGFRSVAAILKVMEKFLRLQKREPFPGLFLPVLRVSDCSVGKEGYLSDMQIDVDPEQDFHVVIDGAVKALSLDDLAEAYQADAIGDETLIWQEGLEEWMRLDTLLAALSEEDETPTTSGSSAEEHVYSVMIAPDEIKSMTLQTLADAHRLGVVDDETLVWQPGYTDWLPLVVVIAEFAMQARRGVAESQAPTLRVPTQQAVPQRSEPQQVVAPVAVVAPAAQRIQSVPNTLAPTAANVDVSPSGFRLSASAPSALDDLDFPAFQNTKSLWLKRSLMGAGALAIVFAVYQGTRDSTGKGAAQPEAAAAPTKSILPTAEPEAEPSAWEKEQKLLEEARKKDEAAAKAAANNPTADAFSASLGGGPKPSKPASAPTRSQQQPVKTKKSAPTNAGKHEYDPMNGAL